MWNKGALFLRYWWAPKVVQFSEWVEGRPLRLKEDVSTFYLGALFSGFLLYVSLWIWFVVACIVAFY